MDEAWGALTDQPAVMQTSAVTVSPHGAAINHPASRSILVPSSWGKESGPLLQPDLLPTPQMQSCCLNGMCATLLSSKE
ncbi:unnamed protein product [Rangifer tarandus platyrhynchus]|uniref:Uncharacterized protein n=2 Tax=Rangifer tarandus platyrhynchus TaxID=3082113 RepID=A0ABN8YXM4_RANTA|nr:unnamed protein product [Rangifer tarandus platyrhynchus]CAI9702082.1 unnamed protein product [Rangifer tarandus platyrhynchus]